MTNEERKNNIHKLSDDELVAKHKGLVCKVVDDTIWDYSDPKIDRDDLVQLGLMKLLAIKKHYDGRAAFSTYAYRCLQNSIRSSVKASLDEMKEREMIDLDRVDDFDCYYEYEEKAVFKIIEDIRSRAKPANRRYIDLYLRRFNGESLDEIAESAGVDRKNIRLYVHRGKAYLAAQPALKEAYGLIA